MLNLAAHILDNLTWFKVEFFKYFGQKSVTMLWFFFSRINLMQKCTRVHKKGGPEFCTGLTLSISEPAILHVWGLIRS